MQNADFGLSQMYIRLQCARAQMGSHFLIKGKWKRENLPISTNSHFYAKNLPPQTKVLFWGNCLTGQSVSERNCRNASKFSKFCFFGTNTKLLNISNANFKTFTPVPETKQETLFGHSSHQISVFRKLCKLLNFTNFLKSWLFFELRKAKWVCVFSIQPAKSVNGWLLATYKYVSCSFLKHFLFPPKVRSREFDFSMCPSWEK